MSNDNGTTQVLDPEIVEEEITVPVVTHTTEIEELAARYALEAQTDLRMAQAVTVTDDASYEQAGQLRVAIDKKRKGGEGIVEMVCAPLYAKWKAFRGLLMSPVDTRTQALKLLSDKRLAYEREQQRKAEEARRDAEAAARKEQERLNKLALERAARAEARGDVAKAEEILDTVPQVTPQPIAPTFTPPKSAGIAKSVYWHAEIHGCDGLGYVKATKSEGSAADRIRAQFALLVTAVAAGEVPLDALLPNESWLTGTATRLKRAMQYPGVRVWATEQEKSTGR